MSGARIAFTLLAALVVVGVVVRATLAVSARRPRLRRAGANPAALVRWADLVADAGSRSGGADRLRVGELILPVLERLSGGPVGSADLNTSVWVGDRGVTRSELEQIVERLEGL